MDNRHPSNSKSLSQWIENFYLFCSAVEPSLLAPEERETYVTIGRLVVANVGIAGVMGTFTIASVASIPFLSIPAVIGGVIWARLIFAIDRPLLRITKNVDEGAEAKLAKALPRLILAGFLSMAVAVPIETWVFRDSVKTKQITNINVEITRLTELRDEEDKKRHRIDPATGRKFIDQNVVKNVETYNKQIEEKNKRIVAIERGDAGIREMAFTEQVRSNWETAFSSLPDGLLHFFIVFLFFGIESLPFIYKLLILPYDSYDNGFKVWRESRMAADNMVIPAREQKRALEETTIIDLVNGDFERLQEVADNIKNIRDESYENQAKNYYAIQANKEFSTTEVKKGNIVQDKMVIFFKNFGAIFRKKSNSSSMQDLASAKHDNVVSLNKNTSKSARSGNTHKTVINDNVVSNDPYIDNTSVSDQETTDNEAESWFDVLQDSP